MIPWRPRVGSITTAVFRPRLFRYVVTQPKLSSVLLY